MRHSMYPAERIFNLEFKFCYFVNGKFAKNLNSIYDFNFRKLSIIAYKIKKIFNSVNLINLSQVAKLNSVYIFILILTLMNFRC